MSTKSYRKAPKRGHIRRRAGSVNVRKWKLGKPKGIAKSRKTARYRATHKSETNRKNKWQRRYYKKNKVQIQRYQKSYRQRLKRAGGVRRRYSRSKN